MEYAKAMKPIALALPFALTLTGCASGMNRVHADCEARSADFPQLAACLRANYAHPTPAWRHYLDTADALAADVRAGRLSDGAARSRLAVARAGVADQATRDFDRAVDQRLVNPPPISQPPPPKPRTEMECRPTLGYPGRLECRER
jgi:hypothetical protein